MIKKTRVKKEGFPSMLSSFFGGLFSSIKDRVTQGADAVLDHIEFPEGYYISFFWQSIAKVEYFRIIEI